MRILGLDPGPVTSGYLILETDDFSVVSFNKAIENMKLLYIFLNMRNPSVSSFDFVNDIMSCECLALEDIVSYGRVVGNSTLDTAKWVGKFDVAWSITDRKFSLISRNDVKIVLCGTKTVLNDDGRRVGVSNRMILESVKDKFEPYGGGKDKYKGTKSEPGPLYGVTSHVHSALALAVVCHELAGDKKRSIQGREKSE